MKLNFYGDFYCNSEITYTKELCEFMHSADRNFINYEAPYVEDSKVKPIEKVGAHLHHKVNNLYLFKKLNITDICLANNHIFDYGASVVSDNLIFFKDSGIHCHGIQNGESSYQIINSLAILNVGESEFGVKDDGDELYFNSVTDPEIFVRIKELTASGHFVIIVSHAGQENITTPLDGWKHLYRCFIDAGASLIVGHHPHVPQHHELHNGKYIFYSLGNFIFDSQNPSILNTISKVVTLEVKPGIFNVGHYYIRYKDFNLSMLAADESEKLDSILKADFDKEIDYTSHNKTYLNMDIKRTLLAKFPFLNLFTRKKNRVYDFHLHNIRFETHRFVQLEQIRRCKKGKG